MKTAVFLTLATACLWNLGCAQKAEPPLGMVTVVASGETARFTMGSTPEELQRQPHMDHEDYTTADEVAHEVELAIPFSMSRYEITNDLFCSVMNWAIDARRAHLADGDLVGSNGRKYLGVSHLVDHRYLGIQHGLTISGGRLAVNDRYSGHPVHGVTWYGAIAFCNFLSELEELPPVYDLDSSEWRLNRTGYRLPTEAEWEYAARKGQRRTYAWGDDIDTSYLNFADSYDEREDGIITTPVGFYDGLTKRGIATHDNASPFGLYDMTGNVWEWCWDWYQRDYYSRSPSRDPMGPDSGDDRPPYDVGKPTKSWRGCGWAGNDAFSRVAKRWSASPETAINELGFRVARSLPTGEAHGSP